MTIIKNLAPSLLTKIFECIYLERCYVVDVVVDVIGVIVAGAVVPGPVHVGGRVQGMR